MNRKPNRRHEPNHTTLKGGGVVGSLCTVNRTGLSMVRFTGSLADNRLPDMAALASLLRDRMPFAVRLGLLAPRLAPLAAVALARMTALIPDQHELLLLADQLRDWTRDDPRLAPRTIRLRELLVELLDPTGSAEVARSLPEDDDCREATP